MYAGHVSFVSPMRDKYNKFYISFEEYEYNKFPPFINAGAYVVSNKAARKLYLASYFVKQFRFDDVYLGMLAKKCDITPYHSKFFWRVRDDSTIEDLNYTVASHEFSNMREMENIWSRQKEFGNA